MVVPSNLSKPVPPKLFAQRTLPLESSFKINASVPPLEVKFVAPKLAVSLKNPVIIKESSDKEFISSGSSSSTPPNLLIQTRSPLESSLVT